MNDWQSWIVALLVVLCVFRIGMSIFSFFRRGSQQEDLCKNCATGCDLKRPCNEKQVECNEYRKKKKKSCCG